MATSSESTRRVSASESPSWKATSVSWTLGKKIAQRPTRRNGAQSCQALLVITSTRLWPPAVPDQAGSRREEMRRVAAEAWLQFSERSRAKDGKGPPPPWGLVPVGDVPGAPQRLKLPHRVGFWRWVHGWKERPILRKRGCSGDPNGVRLPAEENHVELTREGKSWQAPLGALGQTPGGGVQGGSSQIGWEIGEGSGLSRERKERGHGGWICLLNIGLRVLSGVTRYIADPARSRLRLDGLRGPFSPSVIGWSYRDFGGIDRLSLAPLARKHPLSRGLPLPPVC